MTRFASVMVVLGLAAALSGCIVVAPRAYPPPYGTPVYTPPPAPGAPAGAGQPAPQPSMGAPSGGMPAAPPAATEGAAPGAAPGSPAGAPASPRNCFTVTVEGHNETRVGASGQRETVWVPTHQQQVCQ